MNTFREVVVPIIIIVVIAYLIRRIYIILFVRFVVKQNGSEFYVYDYYARKIRHKGTVLSAHHECHKLKRNHKMF